MKNTRLQQKSVYYWLRDLFPDFIHIQEEYPQNEELLLPTIAVVNNKINSDPFELGGKDLEYRNWSVYIYAENKGQLADYADLIIESLEDNICIYDYNQGFPPPQPDQIGSLIVTNREYTPLRTFEELVKKQYWWGVVTFTTYPAFKEA